jgi:hypothetical protein
MPDSIIEWIANNIPWIATLACVLISARIASAFLHQNRRLFIAMALFAFHWTLLLQFWTASDAERSNLHFLPVFSGFLEVYIGSLLVLEAHARQQTPGEDQGHSIIWLQRAGLMLLLVVVNPSILITFAVTHIDSMFGVPSDAAVSAKRQIQLFTGVLIDIVGFLCIASGVRTLAGVSGTGKRVGRAFFAAITLILLLYVAIEVAWVKQSWIMEDTSKTYRVLFAVMKSLYTGTFGSFVAYFGTPDADKLRQIDWVRIFFGFDRIEMFLRWIRPARGTRSPPASTGQKENGKV